MYCSKLLKKYRRIRRCRFGLPYVGIIVVFITVWVCLGQLRPAGLPSGDGPGQRSNYLPVYGRPPSPEQRHLSPTLLLGEEPSVKGKLLIGIPTAHRDGRSYLFKTLRSLTENSNSRDQQDASIVVHISGNATFMMDISSKIQKRFTAYIRQGFIRVLYRSIDRKQRYNNQRLKSTFGDSPDRVQWRANQNSDAASLLKYCSGKSEFYLHLEDDVITVPGYIPKIFQYISEAGQDWKMLEFSPLGAIAKLFHGEDLPTMASLVSLYFNEQPLDFLLYHHLKLSVQTKRLLRMPSLFNHIGHVSTLTNQTRELVDPFFFVLEAKSRDYTNPAAKVWSSIKTFQGNSIENAYSDKTYGFFWGQAEKKNESIVITFEEAQLIDKLTIDTGFLPSLSSEEETFPERRDAITNAVLEISTDIIQTNRNDSCSKYEVISKFKDGRMEVTRVSMGENGLEKIRCLRVTIFNVNNSWIFVRDIDIQLVKRN